MNCGKCGAQNQAEAKVCTACGTPIIRTVQSAIISCAACVAGYRFYYTGNFFKISLNAPKAAACECCRLCFNIIFSHAFFYLPLVAA